MEQSVSVSTFQFFTLLRPLNASKGKFMYFNSSRLRDKWFKFFFPCLSFFHPRLPFFLSFDNKKSFFLASFHYKAQGISIIFQEKTSFHEQSFRKVFILTRSTIRKLTLNSTDAMLRRA